ncbi:MAG: 3-deoxy-D-manno-octulosonic acid transferase [Pseudomonadota bacterium]
MRSLALGIYLFASRWAMPLARPLLRRRLRRGKEDPARLSERLGHPGRARPDGQLVWLHAASVGEALSVLELLRRIRTLRPDLVILVTTGTRTSAELVARRLPKGAFHQYAPVDLHLAVERFLDHWTPSLAVWVENEIWPAMITASHRAGVPLVLLNARMSERSAARWRWAPGMIRRLLRAFSAIFAQDEASAARLTQLGAAGVTVTGTLKEGSAPLSHDEAERQRFAGFVDGRPLWLAASTHEGEEALVAAAHSAVRRVAAEALLILVPRHPERGAQIAEMLRNDGWQVAQRSAGERLVPATEIYIADTLGELGLWYRLCSVAFIGGSLVPAGGHNPFEPAALGAAILHGPDVANFEDGYTRLATVGAAVEVSDAASLAEAVRNVQSPEVSAQMAMAAWEVFSAGSEVTDRVLEDLVPLLPGPR